MYKPFIMDKRRGAGTRAQPVDSIYDRLARDVGATAQSDIDGHGDLRKGSPALTEILLER
jgi:hypothetical protein